MLSLDFIIYSIIKGRHTKEPDTEETQKKIIQHRKLKR
jgi:hypothetical protein